MRVIRYCDLTEAQATTRAVDAIFFEASGTKSFIDEDARGAFRHRWLGRYLDSWPQFAFVACDGDGSIAGYLVGCTADPARDSRFEDIGYFKTFAAPCAAYPAHLHINLAPAYRGRGLGGRLIEAFASAAHAAGAPGMHIVTDRGARNVGFYRGQGFEIVAETAWRAGVVVFMGRRLVSFG